MDTTNAGTGIDSTENYVPPPAKLQYYVKKLDPLATPTPSTIPTTLSICVKIQKTTYLFVARGLIADELGFTKDALEGSVGTQVKGEDEGKSPPQPELQYEVELTLKYHTARHLLDLGQKVRALCLNGSVG